MKIFNNKPKNCKVVPFILSYARDSKRSETYKRLYRNIARHLREFEESRGLTMLSDGFTDKICEDYIFFLQDKKLMGSTIKSIIQKTTHMFRRMAKSGYSVNTTFEDVSLDSDVGEAVYVSTEELKIIFELKLRAEADIVRDRFVISCLTGMRYSDVSKLNNSNIQGDTIIRKTQKTGETVVIPIHPFVSKILKKHKGFPVYNRSLQNYSAVLKRICKKAGLTDKVLWERHVGHKIVRKTLPRYEMISSHTGRRSFATNAYLAGIPIARIMLLTGHKTEESFFRYIRIGKKENARTLSEHPFFK